MISYLKISLRIIMVWIPNKIVPKIITKSLKAKLKVFSLLPVPAVVWYLVDNFSGDSLQVEFPLLLAFLPGVVVWVRLEGDPPWGKATCLYIFNSRVGDSVCMRLDGEPHLGGKTAADFMVDRPTQLICWFWSSWHCQVNRHLIKLTFGCRPLQNCHREHPQGSWSGELWSEL